VFNLVQALDVVAPARNPHNVDFAQYAAYLIIALRNLSSQREALRQRPIKPAYVVLWDVDIVSLRVANSGNQRLYL
jgi:hypothetical protein